MLDTEENIVESQQDHANRESVPLQSRPQTNGQLQHRANSHRYPTHLRQTALLHLHPLSKLMTVARSSSQTLLQERQWQKLE